MGKAQAHGDAKHELTKGGKGPRVNRSITTVHTEPVCTTSRAGNRATGRRAAASMRPPCTKPCSATGRYSGAGAARDGAAGAPSPYPLPDAKALELMHATVKRRQQRGYTETEA